MTHDEATDTSPDFHELPEELETLNALSTEVLREAASSEGADPEWDAQLPQMSREDLIAAIMDAGEP